MSSKQLDFFPSLRVSESLDEVVVQAWWADAQVGPSLVLDCASGSLRASTSHPPLRQGSWWPCLGLLGLVRHGPSAAALVTISSAKRVGTLRGADLYKITATRVLGESRHWSATERRLHDLLCAGVDPARHGRGLHFSHAGDCTLTEQRWAEGVGAGAGVSVDAHPAPAAAQGAWARADGMLTWNLEMATPVVSLGLGAMVPPAFQGFARALPERSLRLPHRTLDLGVTLLARRARARAGCRQWRRGLDGCGNAANFVETEQRVEMREAGRAAGQVLASYVQVRGSIPLLWSQTPTLAYKIPIRIAPPAVSRPLFEAHARELGGRYGATTAVSLANASGREGVLTRAYEGQADAYAQHKGRADEAKGGDESEGGDESKGGFASARPPYRLVVFDFHKECGATRYERLSVLWDAIRDDSERFGYWFRDGAGAETRQEGVLRTNCIDTLDRTNVVQGLLGRKHLEHVLARMGVLPRGRKLAESFADLDVEFRVLWADHGDEISMQYAGTGAMKSAFTRTGKRDAWGLLDDGIKSLTRYYLNNFQDGSKQDALDYVVGNFEPSKDAAAASFAPQAAPHALVSLLVLFVSLAVRALFSFSGRGTAAVAHAVAYLALALVMLSLLQKMGPKLVDRPRLRRDLAQPWK